MITTDPKDSVLGLTTKYGLDHANESGRDVGYTVWQEFAARTLCPEHRHFQAMRATELAIKTNFVIICCYDLE